MGFFTTLRIGASALTAQRLRMDVISNNIANVNTTRSAGGGAFKRQQVVFSPREASLPAIMAADTLSPARFGSRAASELVGLGVQVEQIVEDNAPGARTYQPDHPDADADGFVTYPNVNVVTEMVDMMAASRAYEASVATISAAKSMAQKALELGRA